jgi:hypothetical protein
MMAAYNFQERFVGPILSGTKTQTIRPVGKRRHAKPGERLQLYTGMRTASCRKILEEDPVCLQVQSVELNFLPTDVSNWLIAVDGQFLLREAFDEFASRDGFNSIEEMAETFRKLYDGARDDMLLITWGR